jgi:DNA-binding MarR family transcriptional regulator
VIELEAGAGVDGAPGGPSVRLSRPAVLAWLRLARVFAKIERRATEHVRRHGLSYGQFDVLAHVGAAAGMSQQELADALLVTKGNVCQLLDKLEAADLLVRRPAGRTNRLFLTDRGRALYASVVPEHEAVIAEQLNALEPDEQARLLRLLRRLDHAL